MNMSDELDDLGIIVNSCDSYSDAWEPFFKLFSIYWPDCKCPLYLNSEFKDYSWPGLDVRVIKTGGNGTEPIPSWSDRLLQVLRTIDKPYVLYLQEDYFLNAPVRVDVIREFLRIMKAENYSTINLMEVGGNRGITPSEKYPMLCKVPQNGNYRINTQSGIWKRERLMAYLKAGESVWDFERKGTLRAQNTEDSFYCQNPQMFNKDGSYIYPYVRTGIVRAKWFAPAVVDLFNQHNIKVDFTKRGFYAPGFFGRKKQSVRSMVRRQLMESPILRTIFRDSV